MGPRLMSRGKSALVSPELPKSPGPLCEWSGALGADSEYSKRRHRWKPLPGNNFSSASSARDIGATSPLASPSNKDHRVTNTGYSAISPVNRRASNLVWSSSKRR